MNSVLENVRRFSVMAEIEREIDDCRPAPIQRLGCVGGCLDAQNAYHVLELVSREGESPCARGNVERVDSVTFWCVVRDAHLVNEVRRAVLDKGTRRIQ